MKTTVILILIAFFAPFYMADLKAQEKRDIPKEIAEIVADSAKIQAKIMRLQKEKLEKDEYLLGLQNDFLKNTVKDSPNRTQWSVLFELDKEIIEQSYEYEKYRDTEIIDIIVELTGKKISYETLLSGEKGHFATYTNILGEFFEHNELKLEIFRQEQKLTIAKIKLKNLREIKE